MNKLLGGSCVFCRFLAVALVEPINASGGVDQLLLAREERVAGRTNFYVQIAFFGRTRFKGLATRAGDCHFLVRWMNLWLHYFPLLILVPVPIVSNLVLKTNKS